MYNCLFCGKKLPSVNLDFCSWECKKNYFEDVGIELEDNGIEYFEVETLCN